MSFTLKVTFTGMLLYVPDGDQALRVLFPPTGAPAGDAGLEHAGHDELDGGATAPAGIPEHACRLVFDTAHLQVGRATRDDIDAMVSLRGSQLELAPRRGGIDWERPAALQQVGEARPELLEDLPGSEALAARVVLRDGACSAHEAGGCWQVAPGDVRRMSHVLEWTIPDVDAASLTLALTDLDMGAAREVATLYPIGGEIRMEVWHAPHHELPPQDTVPAPPAVGEPAHHFAALASLVVGGTALAPVFHGMECPGAAATGEVDRGSGVACMGGGG